MTKKRPVGILVIAIFHFIFSACGLCTGTLQLTGVLNKLAAGGDPRQAQIQERMDKEMIERVPSYKLFEKFSAVDSLVMGVILLVSGIGLLNMKPWARVLSLLYAVVTILVTVASLFFSIFVVLPEMRVVLRELTKNDPPQMVAAMEIAVPVGLIGGGVCGLIYPIAVLIVMLLPATSAAFRTSTITTDQPERDDEEDYYDRDERWGRG